MYIPADVLGLDNPHLTNARRYYRNALDWSLVSNSAQFVFICYTNRSGSNFLAEALSSGGEINVAGEFFNADVIESLATQNHLTSLPQHLKFVFDLYSRSNLLVTKITISHLQMLHEYGFARECLSRSRFIFIERDDLLAQAISMQIASQNHVWISSMEEARPWSSLAFSGRDIGMTIDQIALENSLWRRIFAHNKIDFFHIIYEDLVTDPHRVLERAAKWLPVYTSFDLSNVKLRQQRGELNNRWKGDYEPNV